MKQVLESGAEVIVTDRAFFPPAGFVSSRPFSVPAVFVVEPVLNVFFVQVDWNLADSVAWTYLYGPYTHERAQLLRDAVVNDVGRSVGGLIGGWAYNFVVRKDLFDKFPTV